MSSTVPKYLQLDNVNLCVTYFSNKRTKSKLGKKICFRSKPFEFPLRRRGFVCPKCFHGEHVWIYFHRFTLAETQSPPPPHPEREGYKICKLQIYTIQCNPGLTIFGITIFSVQRSTFVCPSKVVVKCIGRNPGRTIFGITIFPV